MNILTKNHPHAITAESVDQHAAIFVANETAFATAILNKSGAADSYDAFELPVLRGIMIVPQSISCIDRAIFADTMDLQLAAGPGNIELFIASLVERMLSTAGLQAVAEQNAAVEELATIAAERARILFNLTNDVAYAAERPSIYLDERPTWSPATTAPDDLLKQLYGKVVDSAVQAAFSGVKLTRSEETLLADFVVDRIREDCSSSHKTIEIHCLAEQLTPTVSSITIDGRIANRLKINVTNRLLDTKLVQGIVHKAKLGPSDTHRRFQQNENATCPEFGKMISSMEDGAGNLPVSATDLAEISTNLWWNETVEFFDDGDLFGPASESFRLASPKELIRLATCLARLACEVSKPNGENGSVITFFAAR